MLREITRLLSFILLFSVATISVRSQTTKILGSTMVDAGASICYGYSGASCGTNGYCWTSSYGSFVNGACTPGGGGGPLIIKDGIGVMPLTGGCTGGPTLTLNFNTYTVTTTASLHVNDNCGHSASLNVTLIPALIITSVSLSPSSQMIPVNTSPATISMVGAPTGGNGVYQYQWQSSPNNSTWTNITGATTSTITPAAISAPTYYRLQISSFDYTKFTSSVLVSTYIAGPLNGGNLSPSTKNITYEASPGTITLSGVTGGNGFYSYQWQSSPDSATWTNITGITGLSYTPGSLLLSVFYRVAVTSNGVTQYSHTSSIHVILMPGIVGPSTQSINYNTTASTMTILGTFGGTGIYSYQWQSSPDSITWSNITGVTGTSYSQNGMTATTYYRVVVTSDLFTFNSAASKVIVYPPLQPGNITPGNQNVRYNMSPGNLSVTGVTGGSGTYTYQWQLSTDNDNWSNIPGVTTSSYSSPPLTTTTYYRVVVSSNGVSLTGGPAVVTVTALFPGTISPGFASIASGTSPGMITTTVASGGACGGVFAYQWQNSTDGINFTNISGAIGQNYAPGNLMAPVWYRRQVSCSGDIAYSNIAQIAIGTTAPDMNFITTRTILKAGVTDSVTASGLTSPFDVAQVTQYFDGLGRGVQTVAKQITPLQNDLVTVNTYDNYGREVNKYLPYAATTNDGNYKMTGISDQFNFNNNLFPSEQYYYSQTSYERSPLNRAQATYAPGINWGGSSRGIGIQYSINQTSDSVRVWNIAYPIGSIPTTTSIYPAGVLYKTITTDEAGHMVVEYKDISGHVILKKVQVDSSPGSAHVGWLCTYYVYDELNYLRFVIQPQAVVVINSNWNITTAIANELCFRYEYDAHGHMIIKKIPGAGETWMVYDIRDRVVMTQDSLLRSQQKWLYTRYDSENRPDSTGLITDPANFNQLNYQETAAFATNNYPVVSSYVTRELLSQTFYDDYSWVSFYGAPVSSAMATNYTGNSNYFVTSYNVSPVYAANPVPFCITRGLATGTKTEVLGSGGGQYLYATSFYDDRGRVIQSQGSNYTGGIDTTTFQYDFTGKPIRNLLGHKKNGNTVQAHTVLTKMDYENGFRLLHVWKNIDGAGSDQLIATMQYDELGQLKVKYLGNNIDSLVYDYNIRGWLTGINKNYVGGSTTNYFGMELGYDKLSSIAGNTSYATAQFSGNIAGIIWKSTGDGVGRKYDFAYDNVNRLTGADFSQNSGAAFDKTAGLDFSVSNLRYDANGNILSMNQMGFRVGGSALIDQLTYAYQPNSNKLAQVNDGVNDPSSKLGDFHYIGTKGSSDYVYDGNGNLTMDNNKLIDKICYNYLNLPTLVHPNTKGNIQYVYDASGNKLAKITSDSTNQHTIKTLYLTGFVYQQTDTITTPNAGIDTLQFVGHEEGRVRWAYHKYTTGTSAYGFEYDFFEKDHLGNIRMVLTQQKDTAKYLASGESAYRTTESQLFNNLTTTSVAMSSASGYPADLTVTNPNDTVFKVSGEVGGHKTGPSLILKVMSGDKIDLSVQSFYNSGTTSQSNSSITDVLASLASGLVNLTSGGKGSMTDLNNQSTSPLFSAINSFMSNDPEQTSKPKAYLNWILLDEQLKYVASPQSGAIVVGSAGSLNILCNTGIPITKNGFLYIWVSNETPNWFVYFDNLKVAHYTGPELEETHYYPGGLVISGISSKALNSALVNRKKFNGKEEQRQEFSDGSGLEWLDYGARMYDNQIIRWMIVDPLVGKHSNQSPYLFCNGNPILFMDPDGRDGVITIKGGQINITSNVYLYGVGATKAVAAQYQSDVNAKWGGTFSAKTSDGKTSFNVNAKVNVGLYEGKEKNDSWIIPESWNPNNRDNFVEVGAADKRSYVTGGDEGEWRSQGRKGLTLAQDDPAPHEVGHLLGLGDRYSDKNGSDKGWEKNIMGDSQNGKVEQRNIDAILQDAMKAYEVWSKDKNNEGKEFRYEIDINRPNKEKQNEK